MRIKSDWFDYRTEEDDLSFRKSDVSLIRTPRPGAKDKSIRILMSSGNMWRIYNIDPEDFWIDWNKSIDSMEGY